MTNRQNSLSGRRIVRNVIWNMAGIGIPLLVAIVAIPRLIVGLGPPRFGVLTLAWMVVGYFSLFDLGLGRALTKLVAERLGKGADSEIPALIWTALALMSILGFLGGVTIAVLCPWIVEDVLKIPVELHEESTKAFFLLAISVPIVIVSTGLRGILEAHQRFGLVNVVRLPLGALTFLGPLSVIPVSNNLFFVVAPLLIARILGFFAYLLMCFYVAPELKASRSVRRTLIFPLLSFGGWMTVSNIVGPVIVYADRLLIGATLSMTAVAYYATPFEVVTKLWVIPASIVGVIFPAFSFRIANDRGSVPNLLLSAMKFVFIIMFPLSFISTLYADELLTAWLGDGFSANSTLVLQIMVIGVLVNSMAQVPSALIQAVGRPDLKAKIHLVELPLFIPILFLLLSTHGIVGAAIAFTARYLFDFVAFMMALIMVFHESIQPMKWASYAVIFGTALTALPLIYGLSFYAKMVVSILVLAIFSWAAGVLILSPAEKSSLRSILTSKDSA